MKKTLSLLLILALMLTAVACGTPAENDAPHENPIEVNEGEEAPKEKDETAEEPETDPELKEGGLTINHEYLDLFQMNKGQVDKRLGKGEFWTEWALVNHDNGIRVGYGTYNLDGELNDSYMVEFVYLPLKYFFVDCPAEVTEEDLKNTFVKIEEGRDLMEETKILTITYKGKKFVFYPEWGMNSDTCVQIKKG